MASNDLPALDNAMLLIRRQSVATSMFINLLLKRYLLDINMKTILPMQRQTHVKFTLICILALLLTACGGNTRQDSGPRGPVNLSSVNNAVPKYERQTRAGNPNTYVVFGKRYYVKRSNKNYRSRGIASWYGKKFHGRKTSNGETYNMYAMTAAHKTLRIPSYVRVTNLENGKVIVVRVNDRGPFVNNRIIDLSYAAAHKLGITRKGTGLVKIAVVGPGQIGIPVSRKPQPKLARLHTKPTTPATTTETTRWQHRDSIAETNIAAIEEDPNPDNFGVVSGRPANSQTGLTKKSPKVQTRKQTSTNPIKPKVPSPGFQRAHEKPTQKFTGTHKVYLQVGAFFDKKNAQRLLEKVRALGNTSSRIFKSNKNNRTLYRVRVGPIVNVDQVDQVAARLTGQGIRNTRVVID